MSCPCFISWVIRSRPLRLLVYGLHTVALQSLCYTQSPDNGRIDPDSRTARILWTRRSQGRVVRCLRGAGTFAHWMDVVPLVLPVRNAFRRQNALHTAPGPVPAPPGAYPSAGSAASFFEWWKAAMAGCRAGSRSSAQPAPPAAAGRRLCRYAPHGPFRRISRGPYIHRRPYSSAPVFSYPIPLAAW